MGLHANSDVWHHVTPRAPRPRVGARPRRPLSVRVPAEPEAGGGPAGAAGAAGSGEGEGGASSCPPRQHFQRARRLGQSGEMLWFQGAIPAAIASAKRSGAVFVVFVAGEGGGGPK